MIINYLENFQWISHLPTPFVNSGLFCELTLEFFAKLSSSDDKGMFTIFSVAITQKYLSANAGVFI